MRRSCPWDEADRRGVEVITTLLPEECGGEAIQWRDGKIWILLDARSTPVEQKCLLAHALVHLDRGTSRCCGLPESMDPLVAREEAAVQADVARWLVEYENLWILVTDMHYAGETIDARTVAGELEVTKPIAKIALGWLRGQVPLAS